MTDITSAEAARLLGMNPSSFRAAIARDPDAPKPSRKIAGANLWNADRIIEWSQTRARRDSGHGRPTGSFMLTGTGLFENAVVTGFWEDETLRLDVTTLPDNRQVENAATIPAETFDEAETFTRGLSRFISGVEEIGGAPVPLDVPEGPTRDMLERLRDQLAAVVAREADASNMVQQRLGQEADAMARDIQEALLQKRLNRIRRELAALSEKQNGDFGPGNRATILGVATPWDKSEGSVQLALESAFPKSTDDERDDILNKVVEAH